MSDLGKGAIELHRRTFEVGFLRGRRRLVRAMTPRRTVFDCIGPDGKITDEGWDLMNMKNPHKKESGDGRS